MDAHDCGDDACWGEYDHERMRQFRALMEDYTRVPEAQAWMIFSHAYDIGYHKGRNAND